MLYKRIISRQHIRTVKWFQVFQSNRKILFSIDYCLHSVELFQVVLSRTNSLFCPQLTGFKYSYLKLKIQFNKQFVRTELYD